MIKIDQIKLSLPLRDREKLLREKVRKILSVSKEEIAEIRILKRSLDARTKPDLYYVFSVAVTLRTPATEKMILSSRRKNVHVNEYKPVTPNAISLCSKTPGTDDRPVIIGSGPAGLFCAYHLSLAGYKPLVIERGDPVDIRCKKVDAFWAGEKIDPESNVSFGEGGAGTFSDGKLYTQVKDKTGAITEMLRIFSEHGGGEDLLYDAHPHIGTDRLRTVVRNMREHMISLGAEFRFRTRFESFVIENGSVNAIIVNTRDGKETLPCQQVVLAIGHSARDTFRDIFKQGLSMEQKAFAVGFRILHPQTLIDVDQYGEGYEDKELPAAAYKLVTQTSRKRGVYSFCMCPGGQVVNASSYPDHLVVNGMSYHKRDSGIANSAIVVTVDADTFGNGLFDGMYFQEKTEAAAYEAGGGNIPVQRLGDYRTQYGSAPLPDESDKERVLELFKEGFRGKTTFADLRGLYPADIHYDLCEALEVFDKKIPGYNNDDMLLAGVETRTSSPVRILRDETLQSNIRGIFPCGEGAGYAGGITSAALDGRKVAQQIALLYNSKQL